MFRWILQCLYSTTTQTHLMVFNNSACYAYFAHHIHFPIERRTRSQGMLCNCFASMTDNTQFWTSPQTHVFLLTFQATPSSCICLLHMAVCLLLFSISSRGPFYQTEASFSWCGLHSRWDSDSMCLYWHPYESVSRLSEYWIFITLYIRMWKRLYASTVQRIRNNP